MQHERHDLERNPLLVACAWTAACALLTTACADYGGSGGVTLEPTFFEIEPNDDAFDANFIGELYIGDRLTIRGSVSDFGSDRFDGFAFLSAEPARVDFVLRATDFADLDICVYDPAVDDFIECFESPLGVEFGSFSVAGGMGEFHLVVSSFAGESDYSLEVSASCCFIEPLPAVGDGDNNDTGTDAPGRDATERNAPYRRAATIAADSAAEDDMAFVLARGVAIEIDARGAKRSRELALDSAGRLHVGATK